jgi:HNH endonuclease
MSKETQFKRTPPGAKTARMLEVEKRIGTTLEKDYKAQYLEGSLGQKRLATRWGVARGQIFGSLRGNRRNWVQMLGLPSKAGNTKEKQSRTVSKGCEICSAPDTVLEKAHWISAREGGSAHAENILKLCPNCHKRLDQLSDPSTVNRAREIILLRAAEVLLQSTPSRDIDMQRRFLALCRSVIECRSPIVSSET